MLDPFWGPSGRDADTRASFRRYRESGTQFFELVPLSEADVAVLPYDWTYATWEEADFYPESRDRAVAFANEAVSVGKPVVVFYETDLRLDIPFEHLLFCTDLSRSTRSRNQFALPGWSEDLLSKYRGGEVTIRPKRLQPVVGFCGYAPPLGMPLGKAKVKETLRYLLYRAGILSLPARAPVSRRMGVFKTPGPSARVVVLRMLKRTSEVATNLVLRPHKMNVKGGRWKNPADGQAVQRSSQLEFLENMLNSDYVLCSRGFGNFSYRFYESLASGRIPVLIDTDCVLPFDSIIDWDSYCIRVPEGDVDQIASRIAEFHAGISPADFGDRQLSCRKLWEEWLSPEGFFANFHRHLNG